MIVLPIIGAITIAQAAIWAVGGVIGGAMSALSGWLVHRILKTRSQVATLEARVDALEK